MKDAFYFSHDSNARNDEKILIMRSVYGAEGYGWYWMLVEMMRDANAYRLQCDGKYSLNALASELRCDKEKFSIFIQDCIKEFALFTTDGAFFWSESLLRRMQEREAKSLKAKQSAFERWGKNANANTHVSERNANASKNDAIKERKGKEINKKENIIKENLSDLTAPYIEKYGTQMIEAFIRYWTEKNKAGIEKWDKQEFFDVGGRLATWHSNNLNRTQFQSKPIQSPGSKFTM